MVRFLENIQKELLSAAHYATMDNKRIVPPAFSPTFAPPHPYFSQLLFNNSYMNRYPPPPPPPPPLMRFGNTPSDRPFSFHLPTQKRRRTKVILLLFFSLSDTFLFSEKKGYRHTFISTYCNQNHSSWRYGRRWKERIQSFVRFKFIQSSSSSSPSFSTTTTTTVNDRIQCFSNKYSSNDLSMFFCRVRVNRV